MPDFCMCENKDCPSNLSCRRFTETPHEHRQSYAKFFPERGKDKCGNFKPLLEEKA